MMGRRTFLGSVAITAILCALASLGTVVSTWAQQPAKVPIVGILLARSPTTPTCGASPASLACFMEGMRDLGYVDGKNVAFEVRYPKGDYQALPDLATELVRLRPAVIYTTGPGADAAANATNTIPIIVGPGNEEMLIAPCRQFRAPDGEM